MKDIDQNFFDKFSFKSGNTGKNTATRTTQNNYDNAAS